MLNPNFQIYFKTIRLLLTLTVLIHTSFVQSQQDQAENRKFSIYVLPTSLGSDLWSNVNSFWLEFGVAYQFAEKHQLGFRHGLTFSSKNTPSDILNPIASISHKGQSFYLEHQYLFGEKWFYATDFYYQQSTTVREEQLNGSAVYHQYEVERKVLGLIPKIGYKQDFKFHFFAEYALGCGIRHISSKSYNKLDPTINLQKESLTNKVFDDGSKLAQRVVLQIKIGYRF